ncbi:PREDICTED: uncharacterized protein LOC106120793 [Papilio xuthus]|uniref:Uncharacterized protein LOC106120793 n=1 Tax=Papilio xuthus TaxID=66420 RepID=A0AAJ7ECE5_PAPXU|nr:PREDICTED: uncharacterized protein LOC106120793 [Papilio xuthus]
MLRSPSGEQYSSQPNLTESGFNITKRKRKQTDDYADLRNDLTEMFKTWSEQQDAKHKELIETILESKKQNEEIKNILQEKNKEIAELKSQQETLIINHTSALNRIDTLEKELEEFKRSQRLNIVEISNLPKLKHDDFNQIIKKLHTAIKVPYDNNLIKKTHKAKFGQNKLIVEYKDVEVKRKVLKAVKDYNKNTIDKLNSETLGLETEKMPIYVSESLTNTARRLYFSARQLVKNGMYHFCWISEGKILMREKQGAPAIHIQTSFQLEQLKAKSSQA